MDKKAKQLQDVITRSEKMLKDIDISIIKLDHLLGSSYDKIDEIDDKINMLRVKMNMESINLNKNMKYKNTLEIKKHNILLLIENTQSQLDTLRQHGYKKSKKTKEEKRMNKEEKELKKTQKNQEKADRKRNINSKKAKTQAKKIVSDAYKKYISAKNEWKKLEATRKKAEIIHHKAKTQHNINTTRKNMITKEHNAYQSSRYMKNIRDDYLDKLNEYVEQYPENHPSYEVPDIILKIPHHMSPSKKHKRDEVDDEVKDEVKDEEKYPH
jgi:hypothetical protein